MTTICSPLVEIGLTYLSKFEGAIASAPQAPLVPTVLVYIHTSQSLFVSSAACLYSVAPHIGDVIHALAMEY